MPSFLISSDGKILWTSEEGSKFLHYFSLENNLKALFFQEDFDKIRSFSLKKPETFLPSLEKYPFIELMLTPLPQNQYLVQVLTNYSSNLATAINARIRENLQHLIPSISYLSDKLENLDPSNENLYETFDSFNREVLQIEQVLTLFRLLLEPPKNELLFSTDISFVLNSICSSVYSITHHLDRSFHWDIPDYPIFVPGSESLLSTMILTLLSNAFEYTRKKDEISITLSMLNDNVIISIIDTGPGIQREEQDSIFSPVFYPEQKIFAPELHLGIPTARKITSLLGGTLLLSSKENQGTSVTISLPLSDSSSNSFYQSADDYLSDRHSLVYRSFSKLPIHPYH